MNKYQEALKTLFDTALSGVKPQGIDLDYLYYQNFELKQLIDERIEFESRKDKLVVGSEWECVLKTYGNVKIVDIHPLSERVTFRFIMFEHTEKISDFLHCFKPIEKGE